MVVGEVAMVFNGESKTTVYFSEETGTVKCVEEDAEVVRVRVVATEVEWRWCCIVFFFFFFFCSRDGLERHSIHVICNLGLLGDGRYSGRWLCS